MGVRGKRSQQLVAPPPQIEVNERQRPPYDLGDEQTEIWATVVASEPADWFSPSTKPLLVQYCRHGVAARRVAELIERAQADKQFSLDDYSRLLQMQQRESHVLAMLATKMRISQQSVTNHRGHKKVTLARKPWE